MYLEFTTKLNETEMEVQILRQKAYLVIELEQQDTTVQICRKDASIQMDS